MGEASGAGRRIRCKVKVFVDGLGETTAELVGDELVTEDGLHLGTPEEFSSMGGMNYILKAEDETVV